MSTLTGTGWLVDELPRAIRSADSTGTALVLPDGRKSYLGPGRHLPLYSAALAATIAQTADTRIACIGDSTMAGLYANGAQTVGNRTLSPPVLLGNQLAAQLPVGVSQDSTFGLGINTGTYGYDPRVTFSTANWNGASINWLGGMCFRNDTNEASSMNVAFANTFNEISVYYYQNTGLGSFNISINGGATLGATVNTSGASAFGIATRSCTLGTHTVNVNRVAAANTVLILGVVVRNTVTRRVQVYNWGWSGSSVADWIVTGGAYEVGTVGPGTFAPHLVFINLGINNAIAGTAAATFAANYQTLIDLYKPTADVVLVVPPPINVAQATAATQFGLYSRIRQMARDNGLLMVDAHAAMGTWVAGSAAGLFAPAADQVHPGATGYALMADMMARTPGILGT